MNDEYEYKIIEPSEDATGILIEKSNIKVEFTLADMMQEQAQVGKYIQQFTAQRRLEQGKLDNILEHHPFVKEMSEQDLFTVHMYQEALAIVKTIDVKLPELEEQLHDSKEEMLHIINTLDIAMPTPEQVVDQAMTKIETDGTGGN
jgi:hypothetical protein